MRKLSLSRVTFASCFCQGNRGGRRGVACEAAGLLSGVRREAATRSDGTPLGWPCRPWRCLPQSFHTCVWPIDTPDMYKSKNS